ncbi:MAG: hypothetical protein K9N09_11005 [Candidatus Cloacimonetes bacterium]|nr:hypothetical protein [Candidatus Cloacimonadota bacterium]MCF7869215.1 hypothetical protein [Candidatus Cloacimonadota bacterium]MCF7884636.1 hypothetical protein [Candidatus Cloacimonadota bacterium]
MKFRFVLLLIAFAAIMMTGCTYGGAFVSTHQTSVELSEANYQIALTDVKGEADAGYVFGASFSAGVFTETIALFRVQGSGMLYQEALSDLWENIEKQYGSIEGKKLALTNVRYDSDCLNLLVFTKAKVIVRADVIEFKE